MAEWAIRTSRPSASRLAYEADAVGQPVKDKFRAYLKKSHPTVKVVAEAAYQITDTISRQSAACSPSRSPTSSSTGARPARR